jgi:alkylmercury lyase
MTAQTIDTRTAFVQYLEQGLLDTNTPEMQRAAVALYRLLGRGTPVTPEQLASACDASLERMNRRLAAFAPTSLDVDAGGRIVAFGGLSLAPTRHRLAVGATGLHTWCVLDALFLPEILGREAILVTHCPASGTALTVELAPGAVRRALPDGTVMSIVAPDRKACCDNLRKAFCDRVNLFRDVSAFATWSRGREGVECVTLDEAQLFARRRNASRYRDVDLDAPRSS